VVKLKAGHVMVIRNVLSGISTLLMMLSMSIPADAKDRIILNRRRESRGHSQATVS